jgi:YHS domain-containing protein
MAIDPVCKMKVQEQSSSLSSEYQGRRYYFCSPGCKDSFDSDPERFVTETDILGRKDKSH